MEEALSLLHALGLILGFLQLLDAMRLRYFPTIHRATRGLRFQLPINLTPILLLLLVFSLILSLRRRRWPMLLSLLPLLLIPSLGLKVSASLGVLLTASVGLLMFKRFEGCLFWLLLSLSLLEGSSLIHWSLYVPLGLSSPFKAISMLELSLFYVASDLIPLVILPLIYNWALLPLLQWGFDITLPRVKIDDDGRDSWRGFLLLSISLIIGVVSALYPYLRAVNPRRSIIGVDIPHYVRAAEMMEGNLTAAFKMWDGSRPLILLTIYGFQRAVGIDASTAVKMLPLLLNPLMVLAVFFLLHEVYGGFYRAGWGALLTACSYQIAVGMYSYFLTNMLGLILVYASLAFLFRALRGSRISLAAASLLGALLVFTHPWTFDQYWAAAALISLISLYRFWKGGTDKETAVISSLYVLLLAASEGVKTLLFHGYGGVSATAATVKHAVGLREFWFSSIFSFRLLYGGFLSTLIPLLLSLLALYAVKDGVWRLYWSSFLLSSSLIFLIGDSTIKSRLLYNLPIGVFAAMGLGALERWAERRLRWALRVFVTLSSVVYLLRSLANLV